MDRNAQHDLRRVDVNVPLHPYPSSPATRGEGSRTTLYRQHAGDGVACAQTLEVAPLELQAGAAQALQQHLAAFARLDSRLRTGDQQSAAGGEAIAISDGDLVTVRGGLAVRSFDLHDILGDLPQ